MSDMEVVVSESPFGWCADGDHSGCKREYEMCYTDPRTNKNVSRNKIRKCGCRKRGCKCYVPPAERGKTKKTRRKG